MSPTPLRDPNAPPDPTELREIPDHQMVPEEWIGAAHNPVAPGAPPSPDFPTGVPPNLPTAPPVNVDVPYAMGPEGNPSATVGDMVTVTNGNWQNSPDSFQYQWQRRDDTGVSPISGAINSSYSTVAADGGFVVFCSLTAQNAVGQSSVDSNEIAVTKPAARKK
jgi:hypothetical protein